MKTLEQVKEAIRNSFVWPGGYPLYTVMSDGELLCPKCAKKNYRLIAEATKKKLNDGWKAEGAEILWEGLEYCGHCGKELECAYPEDKN